MQLVTTNILYNYMYLQRYNDLLYEYIIFLIIPNFDQTPCYQL
jgi:hypothetical protein